ncbi:MAG: hypothetical protein V3V15_02205 [Sphingorhabdus sp.]
MRDGPPTPKFSHEAVKPVSANNHADRQIADPELPFGGSWQISVEPEGAKTRVSIIENGTVKDPLFRFFSRIVFGYDTTMKKYLADLKRASEQI